MFPLSYRNMSGSLVELEMLWEHKLHMSVSTAFSSSPKLSGVLKTKTPKTPKTPKTLKLENKDPPDFGGLRNYDQPVANATES